jgi:hypothetical protein
MEALTNMQVDASWQRDVRVYHALPHEKSSFVCFTHLFSSDSVLASPPRPHLR